MAHTPGPWKVIRTVRGYVSHITAPKENPNHPGGIVDILRKGSFIFPSSDEAAANARLIAAAPDMHAALLWLKPYADLQVRKYPDSEDAPGWRMVLAAIERTTGGGA